MKRVEDDCVILHSQIKFKHNLSYFCWTQTTVDIETILQPNAILDEDPMIVATVIVPNITV